MTSRATFSQTVSVSVDQPYAGDRNVTGQAASGSVPLTVYEVQGTARNYLGKSSSLDQQGFYAVGVSPVLIAGHQIVVVDAQGHSSGVITVVVKTGPAGPTN
jgi:hypothetical protein